MLIAFVVLQTGVKTSSSLWNMSIGAWVSLFLSIVVIIGGLIAFGRFLQTLNGFGGRLKVVEDAQKEGKAHRDEMQRAIDRILNQHGDILQRLGEAKRSAEKCNEDTVDLGIQIGSKIDTLSREVNAMNLHLSQRLKAVETVLTLKGE